jgi:hypothetical protein
MTGRSLAGPASRPSEKETDTFLHGFRHRLRYVRNASTRDSDSAAVHAPASAKSTDLRVGRDPPTLVPGDLLGAVDEHAGKSLMRDETAVQQEQPAVWCTRRASASSATSGSSSNVMILLSPRW